MLKPERAPFPGTEGSVTSRNRRKYRGFGFFFFLQGKMFFLCFFFLSESTGYPPGKIKTRAIEVCRAVTMVIQQEEEKKKVHSEHSDH